MKKDWEKFEIDCTDYLNKSFGKYADFIHKGGADSTLPDILVKLKSKPEEFYIEAKDTPAQCGQFVLLPNINTKTFIYSKANVNKINDYAEIIIRHMNSKFDIFRNAGTSGEKIVFKNCEDVFSSWIVNSYRNRNVKCFIANDFKFLPVDSFANSFDTTATYRIKRSGSSDVRSYYDNVIKYIRLNSHEYAVTDVKRKENKLFITSKKELHDVRFILSGHEFMFSKRNDKYEIRKLSNTYNANVIFSISLKPNCKGLSDKDFIFFFLV